MRSHLTQHVFAIADNCHARHENVPECDQNVIMRARGSRVFEKQLHSSRKLFKFVLNLGLFQLSAHAHETTQKNAFNKYFTSPRVSLSGDRLTTGGDGHAERDGKREKRAVVCHSQWGLC